METPRAETLESKISDYEKTREERMKQNLDRMQKLGIIYDSLPVKPIRKAKISLPVPSPGPARRSSRFIEMKEAKSKADTKSSKLAVKKSGKSSKSAKGSNKPKRPSSAFFVFMEGFREEFKESHPGNKSVAAVGKAGGEKWKSMSDAEKAPFQENADKRKKEYEKTTAAYKKKLAEGKADKEESSDKSRSEVNDEEGSDEEED